MPTEITSQRIHVLFVIVSRSIGGAEVHTATIASKLNRKLFRVSLVYLKDEIDVSDFLAGGDEETEIFCAHVNCRLDIRAALKLKRFVCSENVDIIACVNTYPLIYGWLVKMLTRRGVSIIEIFHSSQPFTLKGRLQMAVLKPLFQFSDLLIYVCNSQKRYWEKHALKAKQISVIHNGVDLAHFKNGFRKEELVSFRNKQGFSGEDYIIGLCGYMRPEKSHSDLLHAIRDARSNGIDVKCLLIGDGPLRSEIESLAELLGLTNKVVITGVVDDVRLAVCACDVIAIPSRFENFSIAALESMALGRPVIMSNVGGAPELVQHSLNGFLYSAGDVGALSKYIQFLHDPVQRDTIGATASKIVEGKFSTTKMIEHYERILQKLIWSKENQQ